ncbi:uncharacterized protein METZ01_LOCUS332210 [marine metagenome]|uniref:Uncharacterized protein n=1 Tax=marine metagenome TaxID=408172 RepID=A0A382Q1Q8_9ZZZZ
MAWLRSQLRQNASVRSAPPTPTNNSLNSSAQTNRYQDSDVAAQPPKLQPRHRCKVDCAVSN